MTYRPPTVYLIRHAQAEHNVPPGYYEIHDAPLTELGKSQARGLLAAQPRLKRPRASVGESAGAGAGRTNGHADGGEKTVGSRPGYLLVSPITRTIQTAIIAFLEPADMDRDGDAWRRDAFEASPRSSAPSRRKNSISTTTNHGASGGTGAGERVERPLFDYALRSRIDPSVVYARGAPLPIRVVADLQENSAKPCDTGSSVAVLKARFPGVDFARLDESWNLNKNHASSRWHCGDGALERRAQRVRDLLSDRAALREVLGDTPALYGPASGGGGGGGGEAKEGKEGGADPLDTVAVVTHGGFCSYLLGAYTRFDNCETRRFDLRLTASKAATYNDTLFDACDVSPNVAALPAEDVRALLSDDDLPGSSTGAGVRRKGGAVEKVVNERKLRWVLQFANDTDRQEQEQEQKTVDPSTDKVAQRELPPAKV